MLLSDQSIAARCYGKAPMISPFEPTCVQKGTSWGLSSYGYDLRLGSLFGVYKPSDMPLDPRDVAETDLDWVEASGKYVLPPWGHCLAHSVEYLRMPPTVTGTVNDKSTYARCFVQAMNTVLEAGWEGQVTLEITNHLPRPVILRPGEGIVQVTFHMGNRPCSTDYSRRHGKYQGQVGVTLPSCRG